MNEAKLVNSSPSTTLPQVDRGKVLLDNLEVFVNRSTSPDMAWGQAEAGIFVVSRQSFTNRFRIDLKSGRNTREIFIGQKGEVVEANLSGPDTQLLAGYDVHSVVAQAIGLSEGPWRIAVICGRA